MNEATGIGDKHSLEAVRIGAEAYTSSSYALAEQDHLWRKVWLPAGRVEDLPDVGDYMTFDILDDALLIVRAAPDRLKAFGNVCSHRGRRLVDTPEGAYHSRGNAKKFTCGFHAWTYDLAGTCIGAAEKSDWNGALTDDRTRLVDVQLDTWGGWIWVNLNRECEPLRDYLEPVASMLDPFQLENMRYKWRKWVIMDCNWKVAVEAFNEAYHVAGTHPQLMPFSQFRGWGRQQGTHSSIGYETPKGSEGQARMRLGTGGDARVATARMQQLTFDSMNAVTTRTLVDAANRLVDELPEGTPADQVFRHWMDSARRDDKARGVVWPEVDPAHVARAGSGWQIFPSLLVGHAVNHALCYAARPYNHDPGKCIFEAVALELYPKGEEPRTEWIKCDPTEEDFGPILVQDFSNMAAVQDGLRNSLFRGSMPNPYAEGSIISLHRNLARYMGTDAPGPLDGG